MITTGNPLTTLLGGQPTPPLLTHAQEISLARRVAAGRSAHKQLTRRHSLPSPNRRALRQRLADGLAAREALVLHNLPLVLSVAGRFRNSDLGYDDLIQEGILGLMKAAERYDPKRGTRFATLAVWWIRQSIGRAITNTGRVIRLPVNRAWKISQLHRIATRLAQQTGDEPEAAQVAQMAGVSPETAEAMLRDGQAVTSLEAQLDSDDRSTLERLADASVVDPETQVVENGLKRALEESLADLDEREAQVLRLRFGLGGGEPRPLRSIASEWHMSPEGIRQISERAMSHLREMPRVKALGVYLRE